MNGLIFVTLMSLTSAVWSNDWTPRVASEGAMVTIEMEVAAAPQPLPKPDPDGARKGAKLESPLDTYRDAKALIEKGNALADRGKAILDQAQRDGKISVDIRLPAPAEIDSPSKQKTNANCSGGSCPNNSCSNGICPKSTYSGGACPNGKCPFQSQVEDQSPTSDEPSQTRTSGGGKLRRFLRWRR